MEELLLALVVGWAIFMGAVVGGCAYGWWRVRRRLRVRPDLRSGAPTRWLLSCSQPARLHRRLRRSAAAARAAALNDPSLRPLAADVQDQAVALESRLLVVACCGRPGAAARQALSAEVTRLEAVAARLAGNARPRRAPMALGYADPIDDLAERLAALEAARREVAHVEQLAGLGPAPALHAAGVSAGGGRPAR